MCVVKVITNIGLASSLIKYIEENIEEIKKLL